MNAAMGGRRGVLLACVAVALALRAGRLAQHPFLHTDSPALMAMARDDIAPSRWRAALTGYYPPVYSAAIRAAHALGLGWEPAARAVSLVAGVATVPLAARLGTAMLGPTAGIAAGWLAAVHPRLVRQSTDPLAESLFCLMLTLWGLLVLAGNPGVRRLAVAGVLGAIATLTRAEGIVLVPLTALVGALGGRPRIRRVFVPLVASAAVLAPVAVAVHLATGAWGVSAKEAALVARRYGVEAAGTLDLLWRHPATLVRSLPGQILRQLLYTAGAVSPVLVLPLALGLAVASPGARRARTVLLSALAVLTAGIAIMSPGKRYVVPWLPLLLPWVEPGWRRLVVAATPWLPRAATTTVAVLVLCGLAVEGIRPPDRDTERCYRDVCAWLETTRGRPLPALMTADGRLAWTCTTRFVLLPAERTAASLRDAARAANADLVIVPDRRRVTDVADGLVPLGERCEGRERVTVYAVLPLTPDRSG
jgi:4-amino-4-deoxy-L-arabinose transferase-like glycosyltransferase